MLWTTAFHHITITASKNGLLCWKQAVPTPDKDSITVG